MQRVSVRTVTFTFANLLVALTLAACASGPQHDEAPSQVSAALSSGGTGGASGACKSAGLAVLDLHGDMREIWKGLEQPDTGKQANARPVVTLDFNASVQPASVAATFTPTATDGSCGGVVTATATASLVPSDLWGQLTTDTARQPLPSPFNVLVRDRITGIVNAAGPVAAGADVTLSSMSVNGTTREAVGLIAGGKVTLTSGSVAGDVTYGTSSSIAPTVSVGGKKSQLPFDPTSAFQKLEALSTLLDEMPLTGSATLTNGTLQLAGTKAGTNVFRVTADQLRQATNLVLSAPVGSAMLIGVAGSSVDLQNKGVTLTGVGPGAVLWNFPAASNVNVSGIGLSGSLLAPRAAFQFASGSVNGTVVARSFIGAGSGTLQYTPLNVSLLLGASAPNAVDVTPATALRAGCSYQLAIPPTQPLTSTGACLGAPFGVTFRVAASDASPTARELVHLEVDPKTKLLRRFTARDGINTRIDDVWKRYEPAPGVSSAELLPVGSARPSSTRPGQVVQVYQQYAQGYPIAGFGYFVTSQSGSFRGANGKVISGLPSFPAPTVSGATALQNALTYLKITQPPWVTTPAKYRAPAGSLVLLAKNSNPTSADFVLVWTLTFGPTTGITDPQFIAIDAATGGVAGLGSGARSAAVLDANATFSGPLPNSTVDTVYNGTRGDLLTVQYKNPDGSLVALLANNDRNAAGALVATKGSIIPASGPPQGSLSYVVDAVGATWSSDPVARRAASLLWGLEHANSFLQDLNLQVDGLAWQAVDGVGRQQLFINLGDGPTIEPGAFSATSGLTPDRADIYAWGKQQIYAVEADTPAHEYGHVLLANLRLAAGLDMLPYYKESGAIDEGMADLFAVARERHQGGVTPDWYCLHVEADATTTKCWRNIQNPWASAFGLPAANPGEPNLYLDTNDFYQDFRDTSVVNCNNKSLGLDFCGVHLNSTIVSHWGYLLAAGSAGITTVPCDLTVSPLEPNADAAFRTLLGIAYEAIRRLAPSFPGGESTFADFRDATLQVAEERVAQGTLSPSQAETIGLAWSAVGLPPLSSNHSAAQPADGSVNVNPWVTFAWPPNTEGQQGSSWDFELADGPFETNLLYHQEGIGQLSVDGAPMYTFALALPPRSTSTYYWRVRPHAPGAWASCYPIHMFVGTGDVPALANLRLFSRTDADGHVPPSIADIAWDAVPGAQKYAIDAASVDPDCTPGPGVLSSSAQQDSSGSIVHTVHTLAGGEHYFVDVHAVGPPGLDGVAAAGECEKLELDTALPKAPVLEAPVDGTTINDHASASFSWKVSGGTNRTEIKFYELDEQDQCSTVGPDPDVVSTPCSDDECPGTLPDRAFPHPNPSGYCWIATAITKNGARGGASAPNKLRFYHDQTVKLSPGVERDGENSKTAGLSDPYGSDVTFTWQSDPDAVKYGLRVWPYSLTDHSESEIDPLNCAVHGTSPPGPWTNCSRPRGSTDYETPDASVTVSGDSANAGRYCWNVWPELPDPSHPSQVSSRQPFVILDEEKCYTSPPATPSIVVDNPPGPDYGGEPITGSVFFPYVPDGQWEIDCIDANTGENAVELSQGVGCTPDYPFTFADSHDCTVSFTLRPVPNKSYLVIARTWNSDVHPPPKDELSRMPDVTRLIEVPDCGNLGQQCCDTSLNFGHCTEFKAWCAFDKTCEPCGDVGEHCCSDANHLGAWYCPQNGTPMPGAPRVGCNGAIQCETCGKTGRACCYEEDNGTHYCTEKTTDNCTEDLKCGECGKEKETCCFGDGNTTPCQSGLECKTIDGEHSCRPPCGSEGDKCCSTDPKCESGSHCDDATGTCKLTCGTAGYPCCKPVNSSDDGCDSNSECLGNVCEARCTKPPGIVTGLQAPPGTEAVPNDSANALACLQRSLQGPFAKTVSWNPVPGAKGYEVFAGGDEGGAQLFWNIDGADNTTFTIPVQPPVADGCLATTVWVRALNDCGIGDFDATESTAMITWAPLAP